MKEKIKIKLVKQFAGLEDYKYVGQADIIQRGYVGGPHGTVAGDAWCCS